MNAKQASKHHAMQAIAKPSNGKSAARALRNQGYVPAVIYAPGVAPQHIGVHAKDLAAALRVGHFYTHTQELLIDGKPTKVLAKEIQRHPVTETPIHIDFMQYKADRMVHVNVTVRITGEETSPGIKVGGVLQLIEAELEVVCRADSIPEEIVVDVSALEIGDSVHMSDVKLPAGVRSAVTDRDLTIASVVSTRSSNMADEAADAAATAAATPAEVPATAQKGDAKTEGK